MNTFSNVIEEVEIDDIPLNKWMNVVLRCKGRNMILILMVQSLIDCIYICT